MAVNEDELRAGPFGIVTHTREGLEFGMFNVVLHRASNRLNPAMEVADPDRLT
ncbi:hypothetical protein DAPPUDRAFT_316969 [Daphnia pulex]|uniref:Uncharacterized protein n=1 Tax=Daphnia pulex TaxID=6669 RepID=E9GEI3_DAPPU|nr:hypothetical protein DAPPUDRAFT_316969 [Daphnia pulex]|eukprot:EFX82308.1 hypothetical protein DAPPUDRAFT_316969 [Daphnia pulex]